MVEGKMKQSKNSKKGAWITSEPAPWFSTSELLEYLGISNKELNQQLALFTEGTHYKLENPSDPESQMLWRVDLVDELLCIPIAPLEREAMLKAIHNHITCHE